MPEALKRKDKDGTPYQRPPAIEAWITTVRRFPQIG